HQTDRLSAAVQKLKGQAAFTERYAALLRHYGLEGRYTQAASPHENGVVEQRHHRFKRALDQQLMLRGSRDFESREAYERFVRQLVEQLNAGRQAKLAEERALFRPLPKRRLEACTILRARVSSGSTLSVQGNVYSVHSRLIGEQVEVRVYAERLEVWYAQRQQETLPRLSGRQKHAIQYRHILDWLVRKPGAFAQYRYREDLFPTSRFRVAYDALCKRHAPRQADREYLRLLTLARDNETGVESVLCVLLARDEPLSVDQIAAELKAGGQPERATVSVEPVDLGRYDTLLGSSLQPTAGVTACRS
ncbi:MAG: IS21 family transposase, partial [Planctomycetota bacterium]